MGFSTKTLDFPQSKTESWVSGQQGATFSVMLLGLMTRGSFWKAFWGKCGVEDLMLWRVRQAAPPFPDSLGLTQRLYRAWRPRLHEL